MKQQSFLRCFLLNIYLLWLKLSYQDRLVPLEEMLKARRLVGENPELLTVSVKKTQSLGDRLHNEYLRGELREETFGFWALDVSTLNFLERELHDKQPKAILEFGSGVSTICLARYMYELHGGDSRIYVFSIEQDDSFVSRTREKLARLNLERYVKILHTPIKTQFVEDVQTECYYLPVTVLNEFLGVAHPDFIVVDGPAMYSRFATLPLSRSHLKHKANFYLDDARRESELGIAVAWDHLPYISILGMRLAGKGMLVGEILNVELETRKS
jgi:hypothetical protein